MALTIVILLCLLCTTSVLAQQEVNYNMYRYHLNLINPAVTGTQGAAYANFSLRTQWVGIADAPETQAFSAGTPNKRQRLGTGFSVINDKTFVENQTQLFADFSYRLPLDDERDLYLGLKAGGTSIRLHADRLQTYGSTLPDQFLTSQSSFVPNIGVGLYYKSPTYFVSLSIPRLLSTERFRYDDGQVSRATDRPHFWDSGRPLGLDQPLGIHSECLVQLCQRSPLRLFPQCQCGLQSHVGHWAAIHPWRGDWRGHLLPPQQRHQSGLCLCDLGHRSGQPILQRNT